jgi:hypothetical protein
MRPTTFPTSSSAYPVGRFCIQQTVYALYAGAACISCCVEYSTLATIVCRLFLVMLDGTLESFLTKTARISHIICKPLRQLHATSLIRNVRVQIRQDDIWAADIADNQTLRRSTMPHEVRRNISNLQYHVFSRKPVPAVRVACRLVVICQ